MRASDSVRPPQHLQRAESDQHRSRTNAVVALFNPDLERTGDGPPA